ncbi:MAG: hypothetical protein MMC23_004444 [Stictis urceolatum]|nr:hypothetical protein [Stictis urceolata]
MDDYEVKAHKIKRLVIACDGTWMNTDSAWPPWPSWLSSRKDDVRQPPSNVTRICRALAHESQDGTEQIIYYQAGVGSQESWSQRIFGGAFGEGVTENIREAYEFLASNWQPGDEIVLLGFSRGAFTARSISGLISTVGILTRKGISQFQLVFKDWENQLDPGYEFRFPETWPEGSERPNFKDGSYGKYLEKEHLTTLNVPIKAVGVWDTVGSLGTPDLGPFKFRKELSFMDTEVAPTVSYAFQALALDEKRKPYQPTVWQTPKFKDPQLKVMKQCWFPGVHSNIGSGYQDTGIADLTLAWMISQLQTHDILNFLPDYCIEQHELNVKFYRTAQPPLAIRTWGLGKIYDSFTLFFWPAGKKLRSPGRNVETDPHTGSFTDVRLRGTNEYIHPSVRIRLAMHGDGPGGYGQWHPEALDNWELKPPGKGPGVRVNSFDTLSDKDDRYEWISNKKDDEVRIYEDKLGEIELELLKCSPEVYDRFIDTL